MTTPVKKNPFENKWGIFDDTLKPVFDVDSCVDVDFKSTTKVSHFPIERGAFVDYDKVCEPFNVRLSLAVGGDSKRMAAFLVDLERVKNSTTLYWVVTPEMTYKDVNLVDYNYKRTAEKGGDLIVAVISLLEIRQVEQLFTTVSVNLPAAKVKDKTAANPKDTGNKQSSTLDGLRARHINPQNAMAAAYGDVGKTMPTWVPDSLRGNTATTPGGLSVLGR
jgi:hypothetical protein